MERDYLINLIDNNIFFYYSHNDLILNGSLHTTIFSKYTELLQLKNIFRIFWTYLWDILEKNFFQKQKC